MLQQGIKLDVVPICQNQQLVGITLRHGSNLICFLSFCVFLLFVYVGLDLI